MLVLNPEGKSTVLEIADSMGIPLPRECRNGFCGACRTKLISGAVEQSKSAIAYHDEDEFLACCSKPVTPIKIQCNSH